MVRTRPWLLLPALLAGWLVAAPAWAGKPEIRDEAKFFSPEAVQKAQEVLQAIKARHHKDVVIETHETPPADKQERVKGMDRAAREEFYAEWARERARALDVHGLIILITKDPSTLYVGKAGSDNSFTTEDINQVKNRLLSDFRDREYDRGLIQAVQTVNRVIDLQARRTMPATRTVPQGTTTPHGAAAPHAGGAGSGLLGLLCVVLVIGLGIWLVVGLIRAFTGGGMGGGMGPGYGGGYGGRGGGFMGGLLGGLFGGMAGAWIYDQFFGGHSHSAYGGEPSAPYDTAGPVDNDDFRGSGGDFGDTGGGDTGGGDFGGGDFGGGFDGGDVGGGGDFGGGDFGGGGDF